jgi:hypothetical protein
MLVASCLLCMGCGSDSGTSPVRGVVMLDGEIYTQGGSVVFQPEGKGKMASGIIQSDGTFELSTYTQGDGAVIGTHKVLVMPLPPDDIGDDENPVPQGTSPLTTAMTKTPSDDLVFEVLAGQTNHFEVQLRTR